MCAAFTSGLSDKRIEFLLDAGADPMFVNEKKRSVMNYAVGSASLPLLKRLIELGHKVTDKDVYNETLVHSATNRSDVLEFLIEQGCEINEAGSREYYEGYTPLHYACRNDCVAAVKLLLDKGARVDMTCEDGTGLHLTSNIEIAKLLIKAGVERNKIGKYDRTALDRADDELKEYLRSVGCKDSETVKREEKLA